MQTKQITFNFDVQTYESAELILSDMGLDIQTAVNIMLKRITKEGSIAFMLQNASITAPPEVKQPETQLEYEDTLTNSPRYYRTRIAGKITNEMRDYIWTVFSQNKNLSYTAYQELAREITKTTGMNYGSAYIYFVILSCFMQGKFNTRTMKISDLEFYIKKILHECSKIEFENTLKSLEESIPYWEEHIQGYFAQKVKNLVSQYKIYL